jgi:hypothetical protein
MRQGHRRHEVLLERRFDGGLDLLDPRRHLLDLAASGRRQQLQRPISLALIGLIVLVIYYSSRQTVRERKDGETISSVAGDKDAAGG